MQQVSFVLTHRLTQANKCDGEHGVGMDGGEEGGSRRVEDKGWGRSALGAERRGANAKLIALTKS